MQLISDEYQRLNSALHNTVPTYGQSGKRHILTLRNLCKEYDTLDVLDYGCGKSTLARNLPFTIQQYDPAIAAYSALPEPADIVVCTDVLEHIEPELLDNVLTHLASLTKKVGFFTASTRPAKKTLADGRNAHLIVESAEWWIEKIKHYFVITGITEMQNEVMLIVIPKEKEAQNA